MSTHTMNPQVIKWEPLTVPQAVQARAERTQQSSGTQQPTACPARTHALARPLDLEVVLPAYNEAEQIGLAVCSVARWLRTNTAWTWRITVADNASTDQTLYIAQHLASSDPSRIRAVHLNQKGRGRALTATWLASEARVVAYMDVDLSTSLDALPALVSPLLAGTADLAIGSRLLPQSHTTRCLKRELISRSYNLLLNAAFGYHVHDAQCGFKAMRTGAAHQILPLVQDTNWFWDTELLVLSHAQNLRILEVPVTWVEDAGTTVNIPQTVRQDLAGIRRMRRQLREDGADEKDGALPDHSVTAPFYHCTREAN